MKDKYMRKIVCAAIKLNGIIIPCIRHWDTNCHILANSIYPSKVKELIRAGKEVQGFLDNKGNFLDREEAAMLFNSYSDKKTTRILFSEDLY